MMTLSRRSLFLAAALAGGVWLAAGTAQAQIGTYEDFPYQQGSMAYRPGGNPLSRRAYPPRRAVQNYYVTPQGTPAFSTVPGTGYYTTRPRYPRQFQYPYQYQYQYPNMVPYGSSYVQPVYPMAR